MGWALMTSLTVMRWRSWRATPTSCWPSGWANGKKRKKKYVWSWANQFQVVGLGFFSFYIFIINKSTGYERTVTAWGHIFVLPFTTCDLNVLAQFQTAHTEQVTRVEDLTAKKLNIFQGVRGTQDKELTWEYILGLFSSFGHKHTSSWMLRCTWATFCQTTKLKKNSVLSEMRLKFDFRKFSNCSGVLIICFSLNLTADWSLECWHNNKC